PFDEGALRARGAGRRLISLLRWRPVPRLRDVIDDPRLRLPVARACAARLVTADRKVPKRTERDLAIDELHQQLDVAQLRALDDDAHRKRSLEHAHRVALGAPIGARRELVLGVHVQLRGGPLRLGARVANEDAATLADGAKRLPSEVVYADLALREMRVLHVVACRALQAREGMTDCAAYARAREQRSATVHQERAIGAQHLGYPRDHRPRGLGPLTVTGRLHRALGVVRADG